jgi:hypothetical protein
MHAAPGDVPWSPGIRTLVVPDAVLVDLHVVGDNVGPDERIFADSAEEILRDLNHLGSQRARTRAP